MHHRERNDTHLLRVLLLPVSCYKHTVPNMERQAGLRLNQMLRSSVMCARPQTLFNETTSTIARSPLSGGRLAAKPLRYRGPFPKVRALHTSPKRLAEVEILHHKVVESTDEHFSYRYVEELSRTPRGSNLPISIGPTSSQQPPQANTTMILRKNAQEVKKPATSFEPQAFKDRPALHSGQSQCKVTEAKPEAGQDVGINLLWCLLPRAAVPFLLMYFDRRMSKMRQYYARQHDETMLRYSQAHEDMMAATLEAAMAHK